MSRTFAGSVAAPYIGVLSPQPFRLYGGSYGIPAFFDWSVYQAIKNNATNIVVPINILAGPSIAVIRQLKSVFIDNLGSDAPVYVQFPDTLQTIVAQPGSADWYPVFTNNVVANVFVQGLAVGDVSETRIFFTDAFVPPFSSTELDQAKALWLASPTISRGTNIYNTMFGTPALGDQTAQYQLNVTGSLPILTTILSSPQPSGFYYLTNIVFQPCDCVASSFTLGQAQIISTGVAGVLYNFFYEFIASTAPQFVGTGVPTYSAGGLNIKLDATQTWQFKSLSAGAIAGTVQLYLDFTYQP
jgi:hypothetical protein